MPKSLNKLTIKGFKSIQSLENFELRNLNVLIGGNGAGKSNFIDFFRLLRAMNSATLSCSATLFSARSIPSAPRCGILA